jgi:antitoxin (DNA-binding transcriptional repressor) of toxin-antitoxin stability system
LLDGAAKGQEVVITREDGAAFKIVPTTPLTPYPKFGSAKGLVHIAEDFDEPLEDFQAYAP